MEKMKELYEKVAGDSELQKKFAEIMEGAEKAGPEETEKKLVAFAKVAGYEVTVEDIAGFFNNLEAKEGALSEEELDAVAGGKTVLTSNSVYVAAVECRPIVSVPGTSWRKV